MTAADLACHTYDWLLEPHLKEDPPPPWLRKAKLMLQHPNESPEIVGRLTYLIHPPSRLAATSRWQDFRDRTLMPMMRYRPDDQNIPKFLKQVERILAYRATIAPDDRFWRADSEA